VSVRERAFSARTRTHRDRLTAAMLRRRLVLVSTRLNMIAELSSCVCDCHCCVAHALVLRDCEVWFNYNYLGCYWLYVLFPILMSMARFVAAVRKDSVVPFRFRSRAGQASRGAFGTIRDVRTCGSSLSQLPTGDV
jgi:hypothetical protein